MPRLLKTIKPPGKHPCLKPGSALSAELVAILQSLHWARDNNKNKVAIFSDSLSGLQAIKNGKLDNSIVNDILLIHKVLATNGYRITFIWIPAHVGVPGNEHADRLAKRAATKYDEALQLPLSRGEAKRQIYLFVQKEWQNEYAASVNGSLYRNLWPEVTTGPTDGNVSRKFSNILFRISTGHCKLNQHLHRIGCHQDGLCERCKTEETIQHFLFQCPRYNRVRRRMTETANRHHVNLNLLSMLRNPCTRVALADFVLITGREI